LVGAALIGLGFTAVIAYGILLGRNRVNVVRKDLYFDSLPKQFEGFKIVQLSDIHLGSFGKNTWVLNKTLKEVDALKPDLLLFTGDIVNNFSEEINGFESLLTQFKAKYGKYAILGNHDYGDYYQWTDQKSKAENLKEIELGLTNSGFKLLLNQWERIVVNDTAFALIGVENWGHKPFPQYADLEMATKEIPFGLFQILMTHDPAHWDAIVVPQTNIPLTLSGHTHGGQFGVKIAGIVFSPMFLVQEKWGGLYESDYQLLYVNTGLGTIGFPGRVEMNPEITLLTLHKTRSH
jgi:predicted MPP superfamily phosphohydrolase